MNNFSNYIVDIPETIIHGLTLLSISKIENVVDIAITIFMDIIETYISKKNIVPVISGTILQLPKRIRKEILKRLPINELLDAFIENRIEDSSSEDNLSNLVINSISNSCDYSGYLSLSSTSVLDNSSSYVFYLYICEKEPIFSYKIKLIKVNLYVYNLELEIEIIHPILIYKFEVLKKLITTICDHNIGYYEMKYNMYSFKILSVVKLLDIYTHHHIFDNLFTHISDKSKNIIEKDWSFYCYWKARKEYLSLADGIPNDYQSHITYYLFNELIMKDVCTYLYDTKELIEYDSDDDIFI